MKNKLLTIAILTLAFSACFNGQQGDEASIILNLGGSTGNRAAWLHEEDPGILDKIVYKVVIDGPDQIKIDSTGETKIKTTVTPGIYTITVEAFYLNKPYAKDSVENIIIKAGPNTVPIILKPCNEIPDVPDMDPAKTYLIAEGIKMEFYSLLATLTAARNEPGLKEFTVSIGDGDYSLNNDTGGSIFEDEIVTIEKHGSNNTSINLEAGGPLFSVSGELTLQGNITLTGLEVNNSALINVYGTFNMYDNVIITGNNNRDSGGYPAGGYGGGVYVGNGGTFNMEGGTISSNEADHWGGGVYVDAGGTFTMNKGTIHGNKAKLGGGVYVYIEGDTGERDIGKFYMNDGEISGNEATQQGGGVYIHGNAIFEKKQGTIYGSDEPDDNKKNKDTSGGAHSVYLGSRWYSIATTVTGLLDNYPE